MDQLGYTTEKTAKNYIGKDVIIAAQTQPQGIIDGKNAKEKIVAYGEKADKNRDPSKNPKYSVDAGDVVAFAQNAHADDKHLQNHLVFGKSKSAYGRIENPNEIDCEIEKKKEKYKFGKAHARKELPCGG